MSRTWLLVGCMGLLFACDADSMGVRHSVEAFQADARLRESVLRACAADPGGLRETPNCVNAQRAAALESRSSLRDSGPTGLVPVAPDAR